MEYFEGLTLAESIKKGRLPLNHALKIAIEVSSALDAAHRKGIIHRDIKPGDILLTDVGAKLLDFGLARIQKDVPGR
jgi:eukaryotic-like serine/threonine-protein kinase